MPIAHTLIKIAASDHAKVVDFYVAALKPLGYQKLLNFGSVVGLGVKAPEWFVSSSDGTTTSNFHVAFEAPDRAAVDAFHASALATGGKDNGAPGIRERFSPNYYAAFALDPVGNNIEVVCNTPPAEE